MKRFNNIKLFYEPMEKKNYLVSLLLSTIFVLVTPKKVYGTPDNISSSYDNNRHKLIRYVDESQIKKEIDTIDTKITEIELNLKSPLSIRKSIIDNYVNFSGYMKKAWELTSIFHDNIIKELKKTQIDQRIVDPLALIKAIIKNESIYDEKHPEEGVYAVSHKGSCGVTQMMPGIAKKYGIYIQSEWEEILISKVNKRFKDGIWDYEDSKKVVKDAVREFVKTEYARINNLNPNEYKDWLQQIDERFCSEIFKATIIHLNCLMKRFDGNLGDVINAYHTGKGIDDNRGKSDYVQRVLSDYETYFKVHKEVARQIYEIGKKLIKEKIRLMKIYLNHL
jgi:hypothetical protein